MVMDAKSRRKAELLESILTRHAAAEQRALSDLRNAGYHFQTIPQAFKRLKVQRANPTYSQRELDLATNRVEHDPTQQRRTA